MKMNYTKGRELMYKRGAIEEGGVARASHHPAPSYKSLFDET